MTNMKKVAIIRGGDLGKYEMQNYVSCQENGIELTGMTSKRPRGDLSELTFPLQQFYTLEDYSRSPLYRRALNKYFGEGQVMVGLEKALSGFDVAHSAEIHNYYTYQAIKAKLEGRVKKVVVTVWQNIPLVGDFNPAQAKFKKIVIENTDLFHAVTEQAKNALIMDGVPEDKIHVQPYGVDQSVFASNNQNLDELREKYGVSSDDFVMLTVSRLVWEKGIDFAILAIKKFLTDTNNSRSVKLLIVGSGPRRAYLQSVIERLGLSSSVKLLGRTSSYSQMRGLFAISDAFILSSLPLESWQEQFGYVLIESMSSGVPIIAARSGAIPEVLSDAGVSVTPGEYVELSLAMRKIIEDETYRKELIQKSLQRASERYDAYKVSQKMVQFYD